MMIAPHFYLYEHNIPSASRTQRNANAIIPVSVSFQCPALTISPARRIPLTMPTSRTGAGARPRPLRGQAPDAPPLPHHPRRRPGLYLASAGYRRRPAPAVHSSAPPRTPYGPLPVRADTAARPCGRKGPPTAPPASASSPVPQPPPRISLPVVVGGADEGRRPSQGAVGCGHSYAYAMHMAAALSRSHLDLYLHRVGPLNGSAAQHRRRCPPRETGPVELPLPGGDGSYCVCRETGSVGADAGVLSSFAIEASFFLSASHNWTFF